MTSDCWLEILESPFHSSSFKTNLTDMGTFSRELYSCATQCPIHAQLIYLRFFMSYVSRIEACSLCLKNTRWMRRLYRCAPLKVRTLSFQILQVSVTRFYSITLVRGPQSLSSFFTTSILRAMGRSKSPRRRQDGARRNGEPRYNFRSLTAASTYN